MTNRVPFSIRPAVAGDAAALFGVHRSAVAAGCRAAYSEAQLAVWFEGRTPALYAPAIAEGRLWLAERDAHVIGFVGFQPGEVTLLFVAAEAAGAGLGRALFEAGLAQAAAGHAGTMSVVATLNSQGFYARHGFVPVGRCSFVRGAAGVTIEAVRMERPAVDLPR